MPQDDWAVVEEALTDWSRDTREWKLNVGDVEAALARLREREAQLLKEQDVMKRLDDFNRAEAAEARVAQLEREYDGTLLLKNLAEARVARLEEACGRRSTEEPAFGFSEDVKEEALRRYKPVPGSMAHKAETPHQGDYEPPEVDDWRPGDHRVAHKEETP